MRKPNSADVAREAGVSRATVSYVLNNRPHVSLPDSTRERVREAALRIGYQPNHAARALVTGQTGLIALWLWMEGQHRSYHARVSELMYAQLEQQAYQMVVNFVGWRTLQFAREKTLSPWSVDGIIAHEAAPAIQALLDEGARPHIPLVSTGAYNLLPDVDLVGINLAAGAEQAVQHLVTPGRKRIAYLTNALPLRVNDARYLAYTRILGDAGLQTEFISAEDDTRRITRQTVRDYVQAHGCPQAILCHNDDMAIGAYRGLCDLRLRVPDDVALVGCDGIEDTEYLETPLSTIALPLEQMFALAWEYLRCRIQDPSAPIQQTWLQPQLIVRQSSQT